MNLELLNPFAQAYPENYESSVEALALCARFNRDGLFAGHFLAVGRLDGVVSVLDFETKGVVRWLEGHVKAVTVVCWSRNARFLLTASRDWNVIIWDLASTASERIQGERKHTIRFDAPITSAHLHPRNSNLLVVTLNSQVEPVFVDLRKETKGKWYLETPQGEEEREREEGREERKQGEDEAEQEDEDEEEEEDDSNWRTKKKRDIATVARFNPRGDLIVVGTVTGNIHIWDVQTKRHLWTESTGIPAAIKHMEFNKEGDALVVNQNDRCIRVFRLRDSPPAPDSEADDDEDNEEKDQDGDTRIAESSDTKSPAAPRPPRIPYFHLQHAFQDLVERTPWNGCNFARTGDYIIGGAGHKGAHNVYMWDTETGGLLKILEGPKDPLEDLDWHPLRPLIASVSTLGLIHIWTTDITENWSAYAPGFEELDENREYEEKEDEFDIEDETVVNRRKADQQDRPVDIFASHRERSSSAPVNLEDPYEQFISLQPDGDDDAAFYPSIQLLEEYPGEPVVESPSDTMNGKELNSMAEHEDSGNVSEELGVTPDPPARETSARGGKGRGRGRWGHRNVNHD